MYGDTLVFISVVSIFISLFYFGIPVVPNIYATNVTENNHEHSDSIKKISGNENQNKIKLINEAEATDGHNPFNTKSLNDDDFAFINDSMKSDMTYDREEGFKIQKSAQVPFELPFP